MTNHRLQLSQPATYRITVQGCLERPFVGHFQGFSQTVDNGRGTTTLTGEVADQCALHGVLASIRDLGLPLLDVMRVPQTSPKEQKS